jgi:hypothetical protein
MCLENATFLAERMVASCQTTNAYYLLGVCHYRSGAPQRALNVLSNNIHQSSSGGGGTKYHDSATAYLMAKCCFDLKQYGRAEETLLGAARADYKEYKSVNRGQGNLYSHNNKDGNSPIMGMDEWLTETSPCPIPNGAAGLYLLGNICRRSNRRRRAMVYYRMSLQVRFPPHGFDDSGCIFIFWESRWFGRIYYLVILIFFVFVFSLLLVACS